ncbi:flagellin, partial [Pseudomonas putida]|uniref:flagellin hook IN motif-containing protein n=1 Tax=Pseudomonas putida TaxID=303 RepID=UPI0023636A87
ISATGLKGSYGEAKAAGAATDLAATVTGSGGIQFAAAGAGAFDGTAASTLKLNDTTVSFGAGTTAAQAAALINEKTSSTGVTASLDTAGTALVLKSDSAFTATGSAATTGFATAGVTAAKDLVGAASISVNGEQIALADGDDLAAVAAAIEAEKGTTGVGATVADGRLKLTSEDGKAIVLDNGTNATTGPGALAKIGLSAGTTQAKLTADTSVILNGVEVKFKKGDTADSIVSSINSASTGVTASKNADNTLALFSNKTFTVANGSAGTGLAQLGLTGVSATNTAVTVETTVSNLSIQDAASS